MAIKKQWFEILAPSFFEEKPVGETLAAEPKQLVGRTLSVSLADLDPSVRKFWLKLDLRITDVQGSTAKTEIAGHDTMFEHIYRIVQRHSRRVDDVQDVVTKDGTKVRVKSILVIPGRVGTSIKAAVRAKLHSTVRALVSNATYEDVLNMIINDALPQAIRTACKKVYPVGPVEIRKTEVLGHGFTPEPVPMPEELPSEKPGPPEEGPEEPEEPAEPAEPEEAEPEESTEQDETKEEKVEVKAEAA